MPGAIVNPLALLTMIVSLAGVEANSKAQKLPEVRFRVAFVSEPPAVPPAPGATVAPARAVTAPRQAPVPLSAAPSLTVTAEPAAVEPSTRSVPSSTVVPPV